MILHTGNDSYCAKNGRHIRSLKETKNIKVIWVVSNKSDHIKFYFLLSRTGLHLTFYGIVLQI